MSQRRGPIGWKGLGLGDEGVVALVVDSGGVRNLQFMPQVQFPAETRGRSGGLAPAQLSSPCSTGDRQDTQAAGRGQPCPSRDHAAGLDEPGPPCGQTEAHRTLPPVTKESSASPPETPRASRQPGGPASGFTAQDIYTRRCTDRADSDLREPHTETEINGKYECD